LSGNGIDAEINKLQEDLLDALEEFVGEKVGMPTYTAVQSRVQSVLDRYVQGGIFDRAPIVDVNHREELAYRETVRDSYIKQAAEALYPDERVAFEHEAHRQQNKIDTLKEEVKDPNKISLFIKESGSYEPYDWNKYDFGDDYV
jgi:polyhydroxyalkanoate synthesis regulator phasin